MFEGLSGMFDASSLCLYVDRVSISSGNKGDGFLRNVTNCMYILCLEGDTLKSTLFCLKRNAIFLCS